MCMVTLITAVVTCHRCRLLTLPAPIVRPAAVITSGPSGVTNQQARFAFGAQSGNSAGVSFECQLADPSGNVGAPGTHDWKVRLPAA